MDGSTASHTNAELIVDETSEQEQKKLHVKESQRGPLTLTVPWPVDQPLFHVAVNNQRDEKIRFDSASQSYVARLTLHSCKGRHLARYCEAIATTAAITALGDTLCYTMSLHRTK